MANSRSLPASYIAMPPPPGTAGGLVTVVQVWVSTSMYADFPAPFLITKILPLGPRMARGYRSRALGCGQPGQLGPGVGGRVVDLGQVGQDSLGSTWPPKATCRPSGSATTVGYQRGVFMDPPLDQVLVAQSKIRVCSSPVPASSLPPAPFFSAVPPDHDELPAGQPGLEGAEQAVGRPGVGEKPPGCGVPPAGAGQPVLPVPDQDVARRGDGEVDGDEVVPVDQPGPGSRAGRRCRRAAGRRRHGERARQTDREQARRVA